MGRYIQDILTLAREHTGNQSFTESSTGTILEGISNAQLIQFGNDAIRFIQSRIISVYPGAFVEEEIINCTADDESYVISDNVFLNNKIVSVEISLTGDIRDYYPLVPAGLLQRDTRSGVPRKYIRRNGVILLNPIPQSSTYKIRVNYYRSIDSLDIRRGQIDALDESSSSTTTLTIDVTSDSPALSSAQYVCLVNKFGTILDYNRPVTSYNSSTGALILGPETTGGNPDVTAVIDDYVVIGRYTTTHLPDGNEYDRIGDYLLAAMQEKIYNVDSSLDAINQKAHVKDILAEVVDAFSEMTEDVMDVPVLDDFCQ